MAERKPLSKKIRFEVFKRDKFTCQYCGRMAPDVILEADHIKPVAKGGKNELINLVTSCKECNQGKSDRELSDDSIVKKQQRQLAELAERKEQLEMILEWREGLDNLKNDYAEAIENHFANKTGFKVTENGRRTIDKLLKEFSLTEILDAVDISVDTYFSGERNSAEATFSKLGGICFNKRRQKNDPRFYYSNYLKKGGVNSLSYFSCDKIEAFVFRNILNDEDFEKAKLCLKQARNWTDFCDKLENEFGNRP